MLSVTHAIAVEDGPSTIERRRAIIEDNALYQNNLAGIRIRGSLPVTVKTCEIYSNGRAGIVLDHRAQVTVTGCNIFQNGRAGIDVEEAVHTTIEDSKIYENSRAGVRIWKSGQEVGKERVRQEVKIANSRIYGNDQAGIRCMPTGGTNVDLAVVGNEIYQNKMAGLRVENDTDLTARENSIYENGTAGIISSESEVPPELDIYQNSVSFNRGAGIHVINGVTGKIGIRNNWIFNNDLSGIACGLWSDPDGRQLNVDIINNTIVSNGSSGQGAGSMAQMGDLTDQGVGIRNDSRGKTVIMNNIVAYNYVAGIMTRRCHAFSYNLLFANGDVGNCCEDPQSAPNWIESVQLGGCWKKGRGDLIADPLFVDPDNYNFLLQDGSPAIDAGHVYEDTSYPPSKGTIRNDMGATGGPYAAALPVNPNFEARITKQIRMGKKRDSDKNTDNAGLLISKDTGFMDDRSNGGLK